MRRAVLLPRQAFKVNPIEIGRAACRSAYSELQGACLAAVEDTKNIDGTLPNLPGEGFRGVDWRLICLHDYHTQGHVSAKG